MRTSFSVNDMTIHRIVEQESGFTPMLDFIRGARDAGLAVVCTIVDGLEGVDPEACRRLAEQDLRVTFRGRVLDEVG